MPSRGRRCINPFASSTTPLTRLFNRGETVESRGCAVVAVLRERAEGGIGGRFWGKVCKLFAVDVGFDDPCLFFSQFSCHFRRRRSTRLPCERKQTPITFGTRCTSRPGCWGRGLLHDASCCQSFCSTSAAACRICSFRVLLALVCKFIEVNGVSVCFRC